MTAEIQQMSQQTSLLRRELLGHGTKVLVVEDDPGCLVCLRHLFRFPILNYCSVEYAGSVNQGMAMAASINPDLLILDYTLPDGTAADLVKLWRDYGYEFPFLVITGHTDPRIDHEMQELGALGFIEKGQNFTPDEIERRIRYGLGNFWRARCEECPARKP